MTDYDLILTGEPVAATAAAKRLISAETVDRAQLRAIAIDRSNRAAARIVAIYALAFTDDGSLSAATLTAIAADSSDSEECRRHAAAALTRLHPSGIVAVLEDILGRDEPAAIHRWCVHALGDMDGTQARNALLKFALSGASAEVAGEVRTALARQWFRTRELGAALRDILRQTAPG